MPSPPAPYGLRPRGVSSADVERAADQLLRSGERPTVEKIRATLGTGSPNTINPLLDAWWRRLSSRIESGPAALHRLPEAVAHVAESLWLQALEEGRRRARAELKSEKSAAEQSKDSYEVRSHVLSLREGELDARLRERERLLEELQAQNRTLTLLLQKEQRTREATRSRTAELEKEVAGLRQKVGLVLSRAIQSARAVKKTPRKVTSAKRVKAKAVRKRQVKRSGPKGKRQSRR